MTRVRRCDCQTEIHAKGGPATCCTCRLLEKRRRKLKAAKAANAEDSRARGVTEGCWVRNPERWLAGK